LLLAAGPLLAYEPPPKPTTPPAQTAPPAKPADPPAEPPTDPELDKVLNAWQEKMLSVTALTADLDSVHKDKTTETERKESGSTKFQMRGKGKDAQISGMLEFSTGPKKELTQKFLFTPTFAYQWMPSTKEIQARELPNPKEGHVADEGLMTMIFGMHKDEAKRRYKLELMQNAKNKDFHYLMIYPKYAEDKVDFKRAQIVLDKKSMFPVRLWWEEPNDSENTWTIHDLVNDAKIDPREFDQPTPPAGWKMVSAPKSSEAPRVIRNSGGP
jgi:TIGR03009 family protein